MKSITNTKMTMFDEYDPEFDFDPPDSNMWNFEYDQKQFEEQYLYDSTNYETSKNILLREVNKYKNSPKLYKIAWLAKSFLEEECAFLSGYAKDNFMIRTVYEEYHNFENLMELVRQEILKSKEKDFKDFYFINITKIKPDYYNEDYSDEAIAIEKEENKQKQEIVSFKKRIRASIYNSFHRGPWKKTSHTQEIIGCTFEELKEHLEQTWLNNYGTKYNNEPVHIDHIIPLSTANSKEDIIKLCHWTNLQYLKPEDNLKKHDSEDWEIED